MTRHDAAHWDSRYAVDDQLWASGPSALVVEVVTRLGPGAGRRALDVGAGEGRHAVWLAQRGWQVTAVDFSQVAVERGRAHAAEAGVEVEWVVADVDGWEPPSGVDLVLLAWLRPEPETLARLVAALNPGGHLVLTGHGRPRAGARTSRYRQDPAALAEQGKALGLVIDICEERERAPHRSASHGEDPAKDSAKDSANDPAEDPRSAGRGAGRGGCPAEAPGADVLLLGHRPVS